jgi:hypothetical protein
MYPSAVEFSLVPFYFLVYFLIAPVPKTPS